MARLPILVLALVLGLAACTKTGSIETSFSVGKEYVYDYETQILSGLPQGSKMYSGLKFNAEVSFQMISTGNVKMEVRSPKIYQINQYVDMHDPTHEMLPTDLFTEVVDQDFDMMKTELVKPVSFSYIRGHIADVTTEKTDPDWSVNVKRGCLSLFELNFNERQSLDPEVAISDSSLSIYRVIEPSVTGECETTYHLKSERSAEGSHSMGVQKVRNYNKCLEKAIHTMDMMNRRNCDFADNDVDSEVMTAQSSVRYNILGSPDQFIVLGAVAESQYNFVPYAENRGRVSTFSNQTLTLTDSRPISDQIPDPKSPLKHAHPLKAKVLEMRRRSFLSPWKSDLKEDEKEEYFKMTMKVIAGIEKLTEDKMEEEVTVQLIELYRLVMTLDKQTLGRVVDEFVKDASRFNRARKTFWDILPTVGTYTSVDVLMDRVESGEVPKDLVPMLFMSLSLLPQPDVFTVKRVMSYIDSLERSMDAADERYVRRSAWLCLGSLGGKMIMVNKMAVKELEDEQRVVMELRERANERQLRSRLDKRLEQINNEHSQIGEVYSKTRKQIVDMVEKLHRKEDMHYKFLALKTIGGLGFEDFYPVLEKVIHDKDSPMLHRVEAIVSFQKMAKSMPDKVKNLLLPMFFDRKEAEEVRMMAYLTSIWTQISRPDLEMIAKSLHDEPSTNVGTLVWSSLKDLSNKTVECDCYKSLARNSTLAMRFAKKSEGGVQFSNYMYRSTYDEKQRLGHSYQHVMLYSSEEKLPRAYSMQYSATFQGKLMDVFEFGYKAKGMNGIMDMLYGMMGGTSITGAKYQQHASQTEEEIQQIKEKLEVKPRLPEVPEGHVYMKVFGQEVMYFDMQSRLSSPPPKEHSPNSDFKQNMRFVLPDIVSGVASLKSLLKMQKSVLYPLLSASLPTETGLPLRMSIHTVGVMKTDGDMQVEMPWNSRDESLPDKMGYFLNFRTSGVVEARGEMEVDFKFIRSAVAISGKASMYTPVSMSFNLDPAKSKLLMKFKNQKEFCPAKVEVRSLTMIRRLPSEASRYPISPVVKEITVVDGVDIQWFSYEIGKDAYSAYSKMTMEGQVAVRRDDNSPFFPFTGRRVVYIKYEPLSSKGLDIQIQLVRATTAEMSDKVHSHPSNSQEDDSWWSLKWLTGTSEDYKSGRSSSRDPAERSRSRDQADTSRASSEDFGSFRSEKSTDRSKISEDDANMGFIDLEKKDLSLMYLEDKFSKDTEIMKSGVKCGLVIRVTEAEPQPKYQVQFSSLYQSDNHGYKHLYSAELRRAPTSDETKPWKLLTTMKLDMPGSVVKPSDLWDNEYQKHIQEQIQITITENGQKADSLLNLGSEIFTKAFKQLKKHQQKDNTDKTIEDVMSYIMETAVDINKDSKPLKDAVQQQRKLSKEAEKLKRQRCELKNLESHLETFKRIMEVTRSVAYTVSMKLDQTPSNQQKSEDSVMVLYVVSSQSQLHKKMVRIVEKLQPVLSTSQKIYLESQLKEQKQMFSELRRKQNKYSLAKQTTEEQKSRLEVEPEEKRIYRQLLDIENKLISVSEKWIDEVKSNSIDEEIHRKVNEVIEETMRAKDKLDEILLQKNKINKMLRVKAVEVLLYQKQVILDIEDNIKSREKKQSSVFSRNPYALSDNLDEPKKKEEIKQKDYLERESGDFAKRLAMSIDFEIENKSLISFLSMQDKHRIDSLQKIKIMQMKVIELIRRTSHPSVSKREEPSKESVEEAVGIIKECYQKIKDIVNMKENEKYEGKKQILSPVIIKSLRTISKQLAILDEVTGILEEKIIKAAFNEYESELESFKQLKKNIHNVKQDTIKEVKKIEMLVNMDDSKVKQWWSSPHSMSEDADIEMSFRGRIPSSHKSLPMSTLFKNALRIQTKQVQLKVQAEQLLKVLDMPPSSDLSFHSVHSAKQNHILYDVISRAFDVQNDLKRLHKKLQQTVEDSPDEKSVRDLLAVVEERQYEQYQTVKSVEDKVEMKSRSDNSFRQPLEKLQQLSDEILHHQVEIRQTRQRLDNIQSGPLHSKTSREASRRSTSADESETGPNSWREIEPSSREAEPRSDRWRKHFNTHVRAVAKISYGEDGHTPKNVEIRMFGKKSLEQLLWEQVQPKPGQEDPIVRRYLQDYIDKDDTVAEGYRHITNELNTYRHLHLFCIYEDSLPENVREMFWRTQEYLKYTYYDRTSLSMPDDSNMQNEIQIITEIRDTRRVDVEVRTPYETVTMRNVHTPQLFGMAPVPNTDSMVQHVTKTMSSRTLPATCAISRSRVRTFNGKRYDVDISSSAPCAHVLAMDCSPHNTFVVTSKPLSSDSDKKVITLLTKTNKVEIIPVQDVAHIKVMVNDEPVDIARSPNAKYSANVPEIRMLDGDKVEVKIAHLGVSVVTDGRRTSVQVGSHYWSKVCGMCGSLDGINSDSIQGPHQVPYSSPKVLVSTYLVPDGQCDAKAMQSKYDVTAIRSNSKLVHPKEQTKVIERQQYGRPKTCFSKIPVKSCPPKSFPEGTESRHIPFYCLRSSSRATQKLLDMVQMGVIDENIQNRATDFNEYVIEPKACIEE